MSAENAEKKIFLRKCHCGEIMVSVDDFVKHGIQHSESYVVSPDQFREIKKARKEERDAIHRELYGK